MARVGSAEMREAERGGRRIREGRGLERGDEREEHLWSEVKTPEFESGF